MDFLDGFPPNMRKIHILNECRRRISKFFGDTRYFNSYCLVYGDRRQQNDDSLGDGACSMLLCCFLFCCFLFCSMFSLGVLRSGVDTLGTSFFSAEKGSRPLEDEV